MITKHVQANLALKIGKLFMFIALFLTSGMKAQSPYVASYPATSLGQSLLITTTDPAYEDMMNAASNVRSEATDYLAGCGTGCEPVEYQYCNDTVCCDCTLVYEEACQCNVYWTNCWMKATGVHICTLLGQ